MRIDQPEEKTEEGKLMGNEQDNITRQNIARKRKLQAQRRRRAVMRLFFLLFFLGAVVVGVLYVGYTLVSWGGNLYREYQTMYAGYTDRQQSRRGNVDNRFDGYTNVLVMGLDDGADESGKPGKRADTIMVISLENETGKVRFINIPRDTWITVNGSTEQTKLKDIYAIGGAPLMVRQVNALLGISIHQYVTLDMDTFADLIDILGGIDIYVESDMNYDDPSAELSIHLKKGYQHLSGQQAQQYLRYRGEDLGDIGRVQRQQKFVKALYQKLLQFRTIPHLPAIADIFRHRMETSAEIFDSAHLANVLRGMSSDQPVSITLPGTAAEKDENIWIPDAGKIHSRMQELFPAATVSEMKDGETPKEESH